MKSVKNLVSSAAVAVMVLGMGVANAQETGGTGPDYSSITGAFSAGDILVGVMAIAGVLAAVAVGIKGAKTLLGMLRGR